MGLKVYKDSAASRQYENTFFRQFQANLKNLFDQKGLDGVLIGFSEASGSESLWPDCILIAKNRLLIIDFKNFKGTEVRLPVNERFETDEWKTNVGAPVKGGSSINPFVQLKRQREKLEHRIGSRLNEDVGGIGCLVVFHGDIALYGSIPGRCEAWFAVADGFNYLDAISDMLEVRSKNPNEPEALRQKYFKTATEYVENLPTIDLEIYQQAKAANVELEKARSERDSARQALEAQMQENQRLRQRGESVEEGIRLVKEKENFLNQKEAELKTAQDDFNEKQRAYEMAMAEVKKETEKTKQETEKTKQAQLKRDEAREKRREEEARARQANTEYEKALVSEYRKKKQGAISLVLLAFFVVAVIIIIATNLIKARAEEARQREQAEQALIEDKKSGKTCIGLDELASYVGTKNACVEYVIGDISETKSTIYLNRVKNTDFAAVIWKDKNLITSAKAKETYLNKRVRVRGTIKYYDGTKYKYHEITIEDLSQIEILP